MNLQDARCNNKDNLSHVFLINNGLKEGDVLSLLIFNFSLEYAIREFR